ncbi:MAG: type II secretory pathway, component PulD [Verrucomicrobiota bacterium]|nr:type II secretory pathway, component PulD [Verrucomicrobiota bacterium]
MKKYLATRVRLCTFFTLCAVVTIVLVTPHLSQAQNGSEKIRLMAGTLRARDSGNLDLAKEKAEELIKIAPNDDNVQRLLGSINDELDRRGGQVTSAGYGQAESQDVELAMDLSSTEFRSPLWARPVAVNGADTTTSADAAVAEAAADQNNKIDAAKDAIADAQKLAKLGAYSDALNLLNAASNSLTLNTATAGKLEDLKRAKTKILLQEARALVDSGDLKAAEAKIEEYRAAGGNSYSARKLVRELDEQISDPYNLDINEISPEYVVQDKIIRDLLTQGRAQYLNGDYDGASATFNEVEARDANNSEAKLFQTRIAKLLGSIHGQNLYKTREQMLTEVDQQWERPKVFDITATNVAEVDDGGRIKDKLNAIIIPQVNFSGMELTRVVETLSELSVEYDPERMGVNIIPLFNSNDSNPRVNISLRNLNLDRILQFVTQQVNFAYDVGGDAVTIQPSDSLGGSSTSVTEFFPISRATVIRLTGFRDGGGSSSGPVDPFAAPSSSASGPSQNEEVEALQSFFQSAGVNFELPGASLAFDGEQLIVTQSRRNLERMRTILRNYNEVKQVEIEAKFLEVTQGDLEEVGFNWTINRSTNRGTSQVGLLGGRNLGDAFGGITEAQTGIIKNPGGAYIRQGSGQNSIATTVIVNPIDERFDFSAPDLPASIDVASDIASNLYDRTSLLGFGGYDVGLLVRALSRKAGSDLMSAPKVTVLSGKRASITVAQELRYPESYGDLESDPGDGGAISIVAGTPQDFVTRNVGVELSVTPNVENDDTISLILEPRVTEFEGFVEYGGPSVALTETGTVVTVPAGFYQPVFSTREISTEVTVFDGATVVMGGLTRDEVKTVNDKIPVLGDIPGLGRLFRSEGETRQKRNLLTFVTANLVSPGGSPSRQSYRNVNANALFQNPTIMTPAGSVNRSIEANEE